MAGEPGQAAHPLAAVLEGLTYQGWQLETPEPMAPQVTIMLFVWKHTYDAAIQTLGMPRLSRLVMRGTLDPFVHP